MRFFYHFYKIKSLSVLGITSVLTLLYCVLCIVTSGPLQNGVSFDREAVYSNLADFEIQGPVIFSLSDWDTVNLRIDEFFSYTQANGRLTGTHIRFNANFFNKWKEHFPNVNNRKYA